MKRFEAFIVDKWENWDNFGHDYYFYDCILNDEFFKDHSDDLAKIKEVQEKEGLPTVYLSFDDTGFLIQVYFNDEENVWAYQGIISCGPKIAN